MSQGIIHSEIELYPQGKIYCNFMELRTVISNHFPPKKSGHMLISELTILQLPLLYFQENTTYVIAIGDSEKVMRE